MLATLSLAGWQHQVQSIPVLFFLSGADCKVLLLCFGLHFVCKVPPVVFVSRALAALPFQPFVPAGVAQRMKKCPLLQRAYELELRYVKKLGEVQLHITKVVAFWF